jgi:hypothetical protein
VIIQLKSFDISIAKEDAINFTFDYTNNVFWICYANGSIKQVSLDFEVISTFKKSTQRYNTIGVDSLGNIYVVYNYLSKNYMDK